jgi:drug/metabolite transporter (DMT)-like permease
LNEPWGLSDALTCLVAFFGVTLIARPWESLIVDESAKFIGVIISFLGAFGSSVALVTIKKISNRGHFTHNFFYFLSPHIPLSPLLACVPYLDKTAWFIPTNPSTWFYAVISTMFGIAGFKIFTIGQFLQQKAIMQVPIATASYMLYVQAIIAFLFEWIIW